MLRCCFQSGVNLNWVIKQKMSHICKQCSVSHRPCNAIQLFYFFMKNLGCVCLTVCLTLSLTMPVPVRQRHGSVCQMDTGLERHRINGVGHLSKWPNTNLEAVAKFWLNFVFGKKLLMIRLSIVRLSESKKIVWLGFVSSLPIANYCWTLV